VGQFAQIAFSGRSQPKTREESDRIFWTSTDEILAVEFGGLIVVFGAWKLLKRLPPATQSERVRMRWRRATLRGLESL